jgi:hypothetical protein
VRSQEQGPVYFLDELDELAKGPPLPEEIKVQVGVVGDVDEEVTITLEVANLVKDDGQEVRSQDLIAGVFPETPPTVMRQDPPAVENVTFTIRLKEGLNTQEKVTYTGLLVARRGADASSVKRLTLVSGPEEASDVAILSPKLVIIALRCPWPRGLAYLCGSRFTPKDADSDGDDAENDTMKPPSPSILRGSRLVLQGRADDHVGAEGVVVDEEGRGQVFLRLISVDQGTKECWCNYNTSKIWDEELEIWRCEDDTALICAHRIALGDKGGDTPTSGKFEGTFYLDASDPENSPSVPVVVWLKEHWTGAFLYLGLGILVTIGLTYVYGKKENPQTQDSSARPKWPLDLVRLVFLVLSGMYVVYLLNPTFGTFTDHVYALLWAPTVAAAGTAIGSVLEKLNVFTGFAGLVKFG